MDQPFPYYAEEAYSRAYSIFMATNNLRNITSSSYYTEAQKLAFGLPMLEAIILQTQEFETFSQEVHDHFSEV